jgi:hypothetical protein
VCVCVWCRACATRNQLAVELLVKGYLADPNQYTKSSWERPLLVEAIEHKSVSILEWLLEHTEADVNGFGKKDGESALHVACHSL